MFEVELTEIRDRADGMVDALPHRVRVSALDGVDAVVVACRSLRLQRRNVFVDEVRAIEGRAA